MKRGVLLLNGEDTFGLFTAKKITNSSIIYPKLEIRMNLFVNFPAEGGQYFYKLSHISFTCHCYYLLCKEILHAGLYRLSTIACS